MSKHTDNIQCLTLKSPLSQHCSRLFYVFRILDGNFFNVQPDQTSLKCYSNLVCCTSNWSMFLGQKNLDLRNYHGIFPWFSPWNVDFPMIFRFKFLVDFSSRPPVKVPRCHAPPAGWQPGRTWSRRGASWTSSHWAPHPPPWCTYGQMLIRHDSLVGFVKEILMGKTKKTKNHHVPN